MSESSPRESLFDRSFLADAADRLLDAFTVAMQDIDTATLEAIADYRDKVYADGWMQRAIRDYVEAWR